MPPPPRERRVLPRPRALATWAGPPSPVTVKGYETILLWSFAREIRGALGLTELLKFPFGKHDDQVDVLSLFGMMLDKLHGRSVQKPKERPYIGTGQYVLDQLEAMDAPKGRYG